MTMHCVYMIICLRRYQRAAPRPENAVARSAKAETKLNIMFALANLILADRPCLSA